VRRPSAAAPDHLNAGRTTSRRWCGPLSFGAA
jgi:hypothetical protein